ncbi:MAG: HEPN domain-containing protein [Candidatus Omnitrophica bacterium]|nr:HEPN domain-containing protein [Candidatus Omnitrophota bacterium]
MNYEKFLRDKLIKKQTPDFKQVNKQLQRSLKDLKTADANLKIDLTWSLAIAYHAMIRAGRALMYSRGYLPTTKRSHKTIIEVTKLLLGHEYDTLVSKFNRLRRRRHDFIYESKNHVTHSEAEACLETADSLIKKIVSLVKEKNPERDLF